MGGGGGMKRRSARLGVVQLAYLFCFCKVANASGALIVPGAPWPSLIGGELPMETSACTEADLLPTASADQSFDWNGWYVGGRVGLATGSSNWSATRGGAGGPRPPRFP